MNQYLGRAGLDLQDPEFLPVAHCCVGSRAGRPAPWLAPLAVLHCCGQRGAAARHVWSPCHACRGAGRGATCPGGGHQHDPFTNPIKTIVAGRELIDAHSLATNEEKSSVRYQKKM